MYISCDKLSLAVNRVLQPLIGTRLILAVLEVMSSLVLVMLTLGSAVIMLCATWQLHHPQLQRTSPGWLALNFTCKMTFVPSPLAF